MEYATPVATAASVAAACCNRVSTDCGVLPLVVAVVTVVACACVEDACQPSYCFALADDDGEADDLLRLWHVAHDTAPIAAAAAVVAAASCAAASRARTSPAVSAAARRGCRCWADLVPCGSNSRTCLRVHKQAVTFVALSMTKMMMLMKRQRQSRKQTLAHCKEHYSQRCGACKCV